MPCVRLCTTCGGITCRRLSSSTTSPSPLWACRASAGVGLSRGRDPRDSQFKFAGRQLPHERGPRRLTEDVLHVSMSADEQLQLMICGSTLHASSALRV